MSDLSLIMTAAGSIVLLLFLVMKARLHAVVSLILVSMVAGLAAGMNPADIAATIQKGMGGTLGFVAVVVALGFSAASDFNARLPKSRLPLNEVITRI